MFSAISGRARSFYGGQPVGTLTTRVRVCLDDDTRGANGPKWTTTTAADTAKCETYSSPERSGFRSLFVVAGRRAALLAAQTRVPTAEQRERVVEKLVKFLPHFRHVRLVVVVVVHAGVEGVETRTRIVVVPSVCRMVLRRGYYEQ